MEADVQREENNKILREMKITADIAVENQRKQLMIRKRKMTEKKQKHKAMYWKLL